MKMLMQKHRCRFFALAKPDETRINTISGIRKWQSKQESKIEAQYPQTAV